MTAHFRRDSLKGIRLRVVAQTAAWMLLTVGLCVQTDIAANAADQAPIEFDKLKDLVDKSLKSGWVIASPGKNYIEDGTLKIVDCGAVDSADADSQDPYVRAFYDEVAIQLRRRDLFKKAKSKQTIEPYFVNMEKLVAQKLNVLANAKLSDEARDEQLGKLDEQLQKTYEDGLQAVAGTLGLKQFEFSAEGAAQAHDVVLHASAGATIDMVRRTTAELLKDANKPEDQFPWTSYQAGDTTSLIGAYYCRVKLGGKQTTLNKVVDEKTNQLNFADP